MQSGAPQATGKQVPPEHQQRCPSCNAEVQEGDIICVQCGTNLLTGQKIAQEQVQAPVQRFDWSRLPLFVGIAVVVLVLAVLAWLLPDLLTGPVERARDLIEEQRPLEAINVLEQHVEAAPEDVDAQALLGRIQWDREEFADAAAAFSAAARVDREAAEYTWRAILALRRQNAAGTLDAQADLLQRLVQQNPDDGRAWFALALVRAKQDDAGGELDALQRAAQHLSEAPEVQRQLGIALVRRGRYEEAVSALEQAQALSDDAAPATTAARAVVASMDGDHEQAAALFESAAEEGAGLGAMTARRLGLAQIEQGAFEQAERRLRAGQEMRKENAPAMFYHALALHGLGQEEEAINRYAQVAELSVPQSIDAAIELAKLHLKRGDVSRARDRLDQAKSMWTNDKSQRSERARQQITAILATAEGRLLSAEDQEDDALEAFQQAAQADPTYPPAALERGLYYIRNGALRQGVNELQRYVDLAGERTDAGRVNEIQVLIRQLEQTLQTIAR